MTGPIWAPGTSPAAQAQQRLATALRDVLCSDFCMDERCPRCNMERVRRVWDAAMAAPRGLVTAHRHRIQQLVAEHVLPPECVTVLDELLLLMKGLHT